MSKQIRIGLMVCGLIAVAVGVGLTVTRADDVEPVEPAGEEAVPREVDLAVISDPANELMNQTAPESFEVLFHTTEGDFTVAVTRSWAPRGADRFYNLVKNGYYDGNRFFRCVPGFVVQWGIHGNVDVNRAWYNPANSDDVNFEDDPVIETNTRGRIVFATSGPDSRSTQLFINYADNGRLDAMGFAPFGVVTGDGMQVVDALYGEYPMFDPRFDRDPTQKISQMHLAQLGNAYLEEYFPEVDAIITATIVEGQPAQGDEPAGE